MNIAGNNAKIIGRGREKTRTKDQRFRAVSLSTLVAVGSRQDCLHEAARQRKKKKEKKGEKKKQKINPGKVRSGGKDTQESREIKPEDILRIPRHKQTDETYARDRIGQVKCFLSNYLRPL